jgi:hypothetical protein
MGCHSETAKRKERAQVLQGRITIGDKGVVRVKRERKSACLVCGEPVLRLGKRATARTFCASCRANREKCSRHGLNNGRGRLATARELVRGSGEFIR